jgi:hypothetical protein
VPKPSETVTVAFTFIATTDGLTIATTSAIAGKGCAEPFATVIRVCAVVIAVVFLVVVDVDVFGDVVKN